ncbi:YafY family transcriptional regulator [Novosphingobium sp. 1949]|uniref:YafY family transcriptional regulator n=1 Tax=Novosphingobium organovorum TaxID=2930092 RepID=A0ABT0B9V6_9SPHN|nr:YafY family protein [Novosphingobium organovorum]MCJ2181574.1 YafY family transcriptional regulator [Novosphingobium organovorum]
MRRTERLFRIIQILRAAQRPVTGASLAETLEISLRSLYRDMAELLAQGVPVRGEAGTGYVLDKGYDLPPLMLTADELEAAVLGAAWVAARGDAQLAQGARDLIAKLTAIVPETLRPIVLDATLRPVSFVPPPVETIDLGTLRQAIRDRRKLAISYVDAQERQSERVIWPIFLAYMEDVRIVVGWCEKRCAFRHFRADRLRRMTLQAERYPTPRARLIAQWDRHLAEQGRSGDATG